MTPIKLPPLRRLLPRVNRLEAAAALIAPSITVPAQASSHEQQGAEQRAHLRAELARLNTPLAHQPQSMPSTTTPHCALPLSMKGVDEIVLDEDTMSLMNPTAATGMMPCTMSALPRVPGTSHLYHIHSTKFCLEQPEAFRVRAHAHEIEHLRVTQRIEVVQSVGDAVTNLTADPRSTLLTVANTPPKLEAHV